MQTTLALLFAATGALLLTTAAGCNGCTDDTSTTGSGAAGPGGTGGAGGAGGAGAGGAGGQGGGPACQPDAPCYDGPPGSLAEGPCREGKQVCSDQGELLACEGQVLPQAQLCMEAGDADCNGVEGCTGEPAFPSPMLANTSGADWGQAVAVDRGGNAFVIGIESGALDMGVVNSAQMFLARVDHAGAVQQKKLFGQPSARTLPWSIALAGDGQILCVGEFNGEVDFGGAGNTITSSGVDFFFASFDTDLNTNWAYSVPGTGTFYQSRVTSGFDAQGKLDQVLVGIEFDGTATLAGVDLPASGRDVVVASFPPGDQLSAPTWYRQIGASGMQRVRGVAVDPAGDVVVAGYFGGSVDFGTGPVASLGFDDIYVVKLSKVDGSPLWGKVFGGPQNQRVTSLALGPQGEVLLSGGFRDTFNFGCGPLSNPSQYETIFVAKLSGIDGECLWSRQAPEPTAAYDQRAEGIAVDSVGQVTVAGTVAGTLGFCPVDDPTAVDQDGFVAKLNPSGLTCHWQQRRSGEGLQAVLGLALDAGGNAWVTGRDGLDLAQSDAFVTRYQP